MHTPFRNLRKPDMELLTSDNTEAYLDVLTCRKSLTVLRSLSDGLWAHPHEIVAATPLPAKAVEQSLQHLVSLGFVEEHNGQYREVAENLLPAFQALAA